MIEVSGLTKRYGERTAIDGVSFKVEAGEIMGFLGPNGAGKTTTMRILAGVMGATSGTARISGFDIAEDPAEAKRRIGYLPEIPPVYPDMTVVAYLDYSARLHGVPGSRRRSAVDVVLQKLDLTGVRGRLIGHLSKGFQQRVGLAQALVHDPEVLILDEPTVGLDPRQIVEIRHIISELRGKHTVILSTHILPEVSMTCDRVVVISGGKVAAQDTIEGLTRQVTGQINLEVELVRDILTARDRLRQLDGILAVSLVDGGHKLLCELQPGTDPRELIAKTLVDGGHGLLSLSRHTASLEDIFVKLTTHEQGVEE